MLTVTLMVLAAGESWSNTLPGDSLGSWSPSPCKRLVVVSAKPGGAEAGTAAFENLKNAGWCSVVLDGAVLGDVNALGDGAIGKKAGALADGALIVRVFDGAPKPYAMLSWVDGAGNLLRARATPLGTVLSQRKSAVKPVKPEPPRVVHQPVSTSTTTPSSSEPTVTASGGLAASALNSSAPASADTVAATGGTAVEGTASPPEPSVIRHEVRVDPAFVMAHSAATQVGASLSYQFALTRFLSVKALGRVPYFTDERPADLGKTVASHEALRYDGTLEAGLEFVQRDWTVSPVLGVLGGASWSSFAVAGARYSIPVRPHATGLVGVRWHLARHFALSLEMQNLVMDSTSNDVGPCSNAELTSLARSADRRLGLVSPSCGASLLARDGQTVAQQAVEITRGGIVSWHPSFSLGFSGLF